MSPLQSLVQSGTKLWLDSIDPDEVARNLAFGATGATSNPIIVSDLIKTGRFDGQLAEYIRAGLDDETLAWKLTDSLVRRAQDAFLPAWTKTGGDDGYVSFEPTRCSKIRLENLGRGSAKRYIECALGRGAKEPDDQSACD